MFKRTLMSEKRASAPEERENLGWLAGTTMQPRKRRMIEGKLLLPQASHLSFSDDHLNALTSFAAYRLLS